MSEQSKIIGIDLGTTTWSSGSSRWPHASCAHWWGTALALGSGHCQAAKSWWAPRAISGWWRPIAPSGPSSARWVAVNP